MYNILTIEGTEGGATFVPSLVKPGPKITPVIPV
jgi:hypothetical protein